MVIGIIAAEEKEMLAIKDKMKEVVVEESNNLTFYVGKMHEREVVLVECGVGKVNAARVTQIMIDRYSPDYMINVGTAGGLNLELKVEDIVIAKRLVQHDFDITGAGNYEKGEICGIGKYFESDEFLVKLCEETAEEFNDSSFNIKVGTVATGDWFASNPQRALSIGEEFEADCIEMEGAAIAQVCTLEKVPFVVIRGISDTPNGNNGIDFHTYLEDISGLVSTILNIVIAKI